MPSNDNVIVTLLTVLAKLQSQNVSMNSLQSSCHYLRPSISVSLSVYVDLTLKALNLVRTASSKKGGRNTKNEVTVRAWCKWWRAAEAGTVFIVQWWIMVRMISGNNYDGGLSISVWWYILLTGPKTAHTHVVIPVLLLARLGNCNTSSIG